MKSRYAAALAVGLATLAVAVMIAVSFVGPVATTVASANSGGGLTPASKTIVDLTTLVYAAVILLAMLAYFAA